MSVASGTPKLGWSDLPPPVRRRIEAELAGRVVDAVVQPGGFSPGAPLRLRLSDGRPAFVKATSAELSRDAVALYDREATVAARLDAVPQAPRLIAWFVEGPWRTLIFEDVDGRSPALPWDRQELDRVLLALADMAERLTPWPVDDLPPVSVHLAEAFDGWATLSADPERLVAVDDPWVPANLDLLAERGSAWAAVADGSTLVHGDIRADQLLLTPEDVFVVDWAHAAIGSPLVDTFFMLPSVVAAGGFDMAELVTMSPATAAASTDDLVPLGAALASYFVERSTLPPPPGLPTLRMFQRDQGRALIQWLKLVL